MSAGLQCDYCRTFGPQDERWLYLVRQPGEPSVLAVLGITRSEPFTFCSMRCVADFAYVAAVTAGEATGTEPPPRSGIGWPK